MKTYERKTVSFQSTRLIVQLFLKKQSDTNDDFFEFFNEIMSEIEKRDPVFKRTVHSVFSEPFCACFFSLPLL